MFKKTTKAVLFNIASFMRDAAANIIPSLLTGSVITIAYLPLIGWICLALVAGWCLLILITKLL